ncbi:phospholipase A [Raphidocelis subcapitata]|uniref:Patatin n=1 Tax=Raphidocelis subcapitata TaxID=307507 RepID=A0A2V0NNN2_9CHLO|nr:phospholipase A [Raphidocelis subcapitata]|eukprot:GBF89188.1 phospholipase A [Raphidocelis subcapitata]
MFRTLYGGGADGAFHLELEFGGEGAAPAARLELDWGPSDEEASVAARLARGIAALADAGASQRVAASVSVAPPPSAAAAPGAAGGAPVSASEWQRPDDAPRVSLALAVEAAPPVLRSMAFTRTGGSSPAPEPLVAALLRECDTSRVARLRLCDGLAWAPAAWAAEPQRWAGLRSLVLSNCGLSALPPGVCDLPRLAVLRLSNNKLTALPPEVGRLSELEVLAAGGNQLTTVPPELHRCAALRELDLSNNRIGKLLVDLRALTALRSLQLYGNALEYLPDLAPATALRSLSLANVRIISDPAFSRFEIELSSPAATSYSAMVLTGVGLDKGHRLAPLLGLLFKRSTVQHPLLAGALAQLCEDPSNLEMLAREDVALQQLVAMAITEDARVVRPACSMLRALGAVPGAAARLVRANAVGAVSTLVDSPHMDFQLAGLEVLASLAAGASDADRGERLAPARLLDRLLALAHSPGPGPPGARVRCACLDALAALAYDPTNRRRFLQSPGLMGLLTELAAAPEGGGGGGGGSGGAPDGSGSSGANGGGGGGGGGDADGSGADRQGGASTPPARGNGGGGGASPEARARAASSPGGALRAADSVARIAADVTGAGGGGGALRAELAPLRRRPSQGGGGGKGRGSSPGCKDDSPAKRDPRLHAIRLLAVLGQNEQVRIALGRPPIGRLGRGVRILAMDGGGMKGMAMVELLRQIERRAGRPIWQLFDVIGGTSTGALLAIAVGVLRLSLDACNDMYTMLGRKVFNQNTVVAEDAGWRESLSKLYATGSHSVRFAVYGCKHDAGPYEELLRDYCRLASMGCIADRLIDTSVLGGPYVFAAATLASAKPPAPYVFRNYELPAEAAPLAAAIRACPGSSRHDVWQAVRASSAAPYYLDDFSCGDGLRFQDGATTANNPAVVALQQARLLHPDLPVDALVSLGCGQAPSEARARGVHSMMDTGALLVEAACSTDRVDEALSTALPLVPGLRYYRFCAEDARCAMALDDVNPEAWRKLLAATTDYCARPEVASAFDELGVLLGGAPAATSAAEGLGAAADGQPSGAAAGAGSPLPARGAAQRPDGQAPAAGGSALLAPPPRLGTARGVLLVEARRSGLPEAATAVEAAAEAVARLPQLLQRCDLLAVAGGWAPGVHEAAAVTLGASTPQRQQQQQGEEQEEQQQQQQQQQHHSASWPQLGLAHTGPRPPGAASEAGSTPRAAPDSPPLPLGSPKREASITAGRQQQRRPEGSSGGGGGGGGSPGRGSSSWLGMLWGGGGGGGAGSGGGKAEAGRGEERQSPGGAPAEAVAALLSSSPAPLPSGKPLRRYPLSSSGGAAAGGDGDAGFGPGSGAGVVQQQQQQLVSAVADALQAAAGRLGVVHLALHAAPDGAALVGGWRSSVFAVVEPSAEATRLAAEVAAALGGGGGGGGSLSALLSAGACVDLGDGRVLCVLSQQRVRTPTGALLTSWMLELTEPRGEALLDAAALLPLAARMPRAVVASAAALPPALVRAFLRAGARAVVAAVPVRAWDRGGPAAAEVGAFFSQFYAALLADGASVPEALAAAEAARPALAGRYACHYL